MRNIWLIPNSFEIDTSRFPKSLAWKQLQKSICIIFQSFWYYADGSGDRFELVDGALFKMALGTGRHSDISDFLTDEFRAEIKRMGLPWVAKMMSIAVQSPRGTRWETARIPDLVLLPLEQWEGISDREAFIPLNESPPLLVVEVVSASTIAIDYPTK